MSLSVKNIFIQTDKIRLAKDQKEILQRLRHPETLTTINLWRILLKHIMNPRIRNLSPGDPVNSGKHVPSNILVFGVSSDAVEDEDRFDGFRAEDVSRVADLGEALGQEKFFDECLGVFLRGLFYT